jgi:hypothetical protein
MRAVVVGVEDLAAEKPVVVPVAERPNICSKWQQR